MLLNTRWYDTLYYFITFIQNKPSQKASPSFIPQSTSTVTLEPRLVTDSDQLHSQLETFPTAADLPQQAEKDNNRYLIDQPSIYIQDTLHLSTRSSYLNDTSTVSVKESLYHISNHVVQDRRSPRPLGNHLRPPRQARRPPSPSPMGYRHWRHRSTVRRSLN